MGGNSDAPASRRPWRRRLVTVAALVLITAIGVRVALTVYAADLFVFALGRALAGSGAEVVFAEAPSVTFEGFESKGVVLRSLAGEEWGRADEASGSARLMVGDPWITVALQLKGARTSWSGSGKAENDEGQLSLDASLPASLSSVELVAARIDVGKGRTIVLDAGITSTGGGSTRVVVERLDYAEPSAQSAAEKMAGTLTVSTGKGPAPRMEIDVRKGAVLAGSVLFDFEAHPVRLAANVRQKKDRLEFGDAAFTLGKLLRGTGSFAFADGTLATADLRLASDDLEPAWATLVREPFAGVAPALTGSELRGRGELRLEFAAPSRHRASATATLSLDSLRTRSMEAEGIITDLPWIGAEKSGEAARSGRLRAKSVSLLGLKWTGLDVALDASAGRLRAKSLQEWKTAGGTMRVSNLAYDDDAKNGPRLAGDVELSGFDMAALGAALGWKGLSGSLRGNLGRVVVDSEAVRAAGGIDVETWGGSVTLSNLFVEDPFGRVPELGLDAAVREIDLARSTAALGFGRISGVLEGHVTGLVIADGQAQAFDADLHTVERRGVSQTIDVRAIAQLGALGGDTGSLTGSLLKVIDRYRYSAMGIRCRLRNDVFEIRGVETRGGRDYLVKGSLLPPSVSVVSHSQVLSFSEMLRRVEAIGKMEETEEGGSRDVQPHQ